MARLAEQIREALTAFAGLRTQPALIDGLALAAHQVVRATRDVDFLVDATMPINCTRFCSPSGTDASTAARMPPTTFATMKVWTSCTRTGPKRVGCSLRHRSATQAWGACV